MECFVVFLFPVVVQLNAPLVEVLESENSSNDPATLLNVLKMASYLLCQYMEAFESEVSRPLAVLPSGKVSFIGCNQICITSHCISWSLHPWLGGKFPSHQILLTL